MIFSCISKRFFEVDNIIKERVKVRAMFKVKVNAKAKVKLLLRCKFS